MDAGGAAELGDEEGALAALGGGGHDVGGAEEHAAIVHGHASPERCRGLILRQKCMRNP